MRVGLYSTQVLKKSEQYNKYQYIYTVDQMDKIRACAAAELLRFCTGTEVVERPDQSLRDPIIHADNQ